MVFLVPTEKTWIRHLAVDHVILRFISSGINTSISGICKNRGFLGFCNNNNNNNNNNFKTSTKLFLRARHCVKCFSYIKSSPYGSYCYLISFIMGFLVPKNLVKSISWERAHKPALNCCLPCPYTQPLISPGFSKMK